ncbi:MAG: hypothetical protein HDKAJFGB_01800 [Anaerolineae bacterium]|nr:hypothetical protein [Anaerolineae bacterium]RIK34206.1 MAG: hypothetical protein DCC52_01310 [Chloroflexota bacterium]
MRQVSFPASFDARLPGWLRGALRDRYFWAMLIVALFVNVGLFAFLFLVMPQLPLLTSLHFNAAGQPDRIEPKEAIFSLPQIGLVMIGLNFALGALAHRRETLVSYLLGGVAIGAQFLLWFAAISIVRFAIA